MTSSPDSAPGGGPYALCCCTVSLESFKSRFGLTANGPYIRIDSEGGWKKPPIRKIMAPPIFYGHIRFSGTVEPISGKRGLGFIPHAAVYCGTDRTFLEALEHYKSNPGLQAHTALYLEKHSHLAFADGEFHVEGRPGDPGVVLIQPKGADDPGMNVSILIPGGRFRFAESHFEICPA